MMSDRTEGLPGIAFAAAGAFGLGLLAGLVVGEWLGGVDADRVRKAVDRLRTENTPPAGGAALEAAVRGALRADPGTRYLKVQVRALGERLLELTGRINSDSARERAGATARAAAPGCTVINRLLVEGEDTPRGAGSARPAR